MHADLSSKLHSSRSRPTPFTQASPPNAPQLSQSGSNPAAAKYAHCLMLLFSVRSDANLTSSCSSFTSGIQVARDCSPSASCDSQSQKSLLKSDNGFESR